LAEKFGVAGRCCFCVFAGVFEKSGVQNVVFLWSTCGELCGKGGYLTDAVLRFPGDTFSPDGALLCEGFGSSGPDLWTHPEDDMLDDITVGLIALGFIALAFVGACLCDVFRVRREQQRAEYLPKVKVKRVDVRGKIPSGIAE
jgi:hypothetical protein